MIKKISIGIIGLGIGSTALFADLKVPKMELKDREGNVIVKQKLLTVEEKEVVTQKRLKERKVMKKNLSKIVKKPVANKIHNNDNNNVNVDNNNNDKINNNNNGHSQEKNYELLLKLLVSDDKENMNIALTQAEINQKEKEEAAQKELENKAYSLRELNRQKKLLPIPKKTIKIGDNRIVYADYTIYPYIPEIKNNIEDAIEDLGKTNTIKEIKLEQGNETSVIAVQNGDIFMQNWIVDETTDSFILYKHIFRKNISVKKYMLNKDNK